MAKPNKKAPLGWLAGFLDGEGSFMIIERKSRQGVRKPYWEPAVSVVNTDVNIIQEISEWFPGGRIYHVPIRGRWRATAQCKWTDAAAGDLIRAILPHLMMKRRQAELVLSLIEDKAKQPIPGRAGHPVEVVQFRQGIADEVRRLNKTGVD